MDYTFVIHGEAWICLDKHDFALIIHSAKTKLDIYVCSQKLQYVALIKKHNNQSSLKPQYSANE